MAMLGFFIVEQCTCVIINLLHTCFFPSHIMVKTYVGSVVFLHFELEPPQLWGLFLSLCIHAGVHLQSFVFRMMGVYFFYFRNTLTLRCLLVQCTCTRPIDCAIPLCNCVFVYLQVGSFVCLCLSVSCCGRRWWLMILGQWRAFKPLYIAQSRDLDRCYRCLMDWITNWLTILKDRATHFLIKYKTGTLVTQCKSTAFT